MDAPYRPLLETEKRVLFGLVRHPGLPDRELANRIGLKLPTVTATRLKLERRELIRPVRIPAFNRLGMEMLSFSLISYGAHPPMDRKVSTIAPVVRRPEFVLVFSEPNQDLLLQIGPDA